MCKNTRIGLSELRNNFARDDVLKLLPRIHLHAQLESTGNTGLGIELTVFGSALAAAALSRKLQKCKGMYGSLTELHSLLLYVALADSNHCRGDILILA